MKLALETINGLERDGVIVSFAIGGAMALLFHAEPVATYDLDIFCLLPGAGVLVSLAPVYEVLQRAGFETDAEAIVIGGVPVQFIPAYNVLVTEALEQAEARSFESIPTRVLRIEHLLAIMLQTNRPKDRERLAALRDQVALDEELFRAILGRHGLIQAWESFRTSR